MKINLSLLSTLLVAVSMLTCQHSQAQSSYAFSKTGDAIANTGTVDIIYKVSTASAYDKISFQPVITKVSGTVSVVSILSGSNDGVNYYSLGDTLNSSNQATNSAIWSKPAYYNYYRVRSVGTGTMNAIPKVFYRLSK